MHGLKFWLRMAGSRYTAFKQFAARHLPLTRYEDLFDAHYRCFRGDDPPDRTGFGRRPRAALAASRGHRGR
ncbi:hypothetical protein BGLA2_2990013 [Burkholderia gladioli]|nr:hypothetical protein BGLA2_2990013 [Burkholderia gladioli]